MGAWAEVRQDGSLKLGTQARFHGMTLSVNLNRFVPSASISIPLARWLRIDSWFPVSAVFGVSAAGLSVGPSIPSSGSAAAGVDGPASL